MSHQKKLFMIDRQMFLIVELDSWLHGKISTLILLVKICTRTVVELMLLGRISMKLLVLDIAMSVSSLMMSSVRVVSSMILVAELTIIPVRPCCTKLAMKAEYTWLLRLPSS